MIVFDTLDYLESGNAIQQKSYSLLKKHKIFESLAGFDPILVGTIPIDIAIDSSDLDIACYWKDKKVFQETVLCCFSQYQNFKWMQIDLVGNDTVVASFFIESIEIEIFGQNIPTKAQNGYRHMLIEHRILQERGEAFRNEIIALKRSGIKTEPAFAQLLQIEGDPYQGLLQYK